MQNLKTIPERDTHPTGIREKAVRREGALGRILTVIFERADAGRVPEAVRDESAAVFDAYIDWHRLGAGRRLV